jgi:hypothetical protein
MKKSGKGLLGLKSWLFFIRPFKKREGEKFIVGVGDRLLYAWIRRRLITKRILLLVPADSACPKFPSRGLFYLLFNVQRA